MRLISFDYVCDECEHTFTHYQRDPKTHLKKCPECKKLALRRLFPAPAAHMRYSPMHPRVNRGRGH
jgi:putative FmdB family regulatory protein